MAALSGRDLRALKVLAVFLLVAGSVALYIYVFIPQQEKLMAARADLETAEGQLKADLVRLNKANQADATLKSELELLRAEEALIADQDKQAFFLRDVEAMAKKAGVRIDSTRFATGKPLGRFLDVPAVIELTGSYNGIKAFYDSLEVLNRKLAVKSFSFDLQAEVAETATGVKQKDVLHSVCNLSLFIRPKGGVADGSGK